MLYSIGGYPYMTNEHCHFIYDTDDFTLEKHCDAELSEFLEAGGVIERLRSSPDGRLYSYCLWNDPCMTVMNDDVVFVPSRSYGVYRLITSDDEMYTMRLADVAGAVRILYAGGRSLHFLRAKSKKELECVIYNISMIGGRPMFCSFAKTRKELLLG